MPSTSFYVSEQTLRNIQETIYNEHLRENPRFLNRSELVAYALNVFLGGDIPDTATLIHEIREVKQILSGIKQGQYSYQQVEDDVQQKLSLIDDLID